jgi:hypothetical protein
VSEILRDKNKKSHSQKEWLSNSIEEVGNLSQFAHVNHEARLDVSGLVLVDDVRLSELIEHLLYFRKKFNCYSFVGSSAELANCVTHSLSVVTIVQATSGGLTNSLYR